jgi:hypothetical protein
MTETTDGRPSETEAPILQPFYLTFGTKYRPYPVEAFGEEVHPHWAKATGEGWVTIMATDWPAARHLAHLYFDDKYAFMYDRDDFDTSHSRKYYAMGQIAVITQGAEATPDTLVPRFQPHEPEYHNWFPNSVVAVRIEGRRTGYPYEGHDDVELFHVGDCAERGTKLFESVFNVDPEVLALELDWTNLPECAQCHTRIPKSSIS